MTTSMVLCNNLSFNTNQSQNPPRNRNSLTKSYRLLLQFGNKSRGFCGVVANAKKKGENHSKRKRGWWQRFFIDEEGNWLGLKDDDVLDAEAELSENSSDEGLSEEDKFEAWKRRAEAIVDLREAQEDMLNEESRKWEDWIVDYGDNGHDDDSNGSWWSKELLEMGAQWRMCGRILLTLYLRKDLSSLLEIWFLVGKRRVCFMKTACSGMPH